MHFCFVSRDLTAAVNFAVHALMACALNVVIHLMLKLLMFLTCLANSLKMCHAQMFNT